MWIDALREMKAKSGLTTLEISKGSGIPEPTLEKLFAGATKEPKLPTIQKLVYFLGGNLEDLFKDEKNTPAPSEDGTRATQEDVMKAFISSGLVPANKDLTQDDVRFLKIIIDAIDGWFAK